MPLLPRRNQERSETTRQLVSLCFDPEGTRLPSAEEGWERLVSLALVHGVAPFLWANLKDRQLPPAVHARLGTLYAANLLRNQLLKAEQESVLAALAQESLRAWPLKGTHLSEMLYGDPGIRQTTDLDLLIQPTDLEKVDQILTALGYVRQLQGDMARIRRSQELLYIKISEQAVRVFLDLHLRLLPYVERDPMSERVRTLGMTWENLLLYLCVNQLAHRFARLKYVLDLGRVIEQAAVRLDWDLVVTLARQLEFAPGIYYSLEIAHALPGSPVPAPVIAALQPGRLDRHFAYWVLGRDLVSTLARGPSLEGPYGALAVLVGTQAGMPRIRQAARMLFPPAAYLRQFYGTRADEATLPLYGYRLVTKLPAAIRDLVREAFRSE